MPVIPLLLQTTQSDTLLPLPSSQVDPQLWDTQSPSHQISYLPYHLTTNLTKYITKVALPATSLRRMRPYTSSKTQGQLYSVMPFPLLPLLTPISSELYIWRFDVQKTYTQQSNQTTHMVVSRDCKKEKLLPITPESTSETPAPMLVFSMIRLEITVDAGQKLIEVALISPVRDTTNIQECTLPFVQNGEFLYSD